MSGKPKVAFFDFAGCEGCQLQIADLEEELIGLVGLVDVVEFREVLTGSAPAYDVAFIEGSITRPEDETRLKDIRARSKPAGSTSSKTCATSPRCAKRCTATNGTCRTLLRIPQRRCTKW
jgi:sulfhydrogenase subunit delta